MSPDHSSNNVLKPDPSKDNQSISDIDDEDDDDLDNQLMRGITVTKSPEGTKDDKNISGEDNQTKKKTESVTCKFRFEAK